MSHVLHIHRDMVGRATLLHLLGLACSRPEVGQLEQLFFSVTCAKHLSVSAHGVLLLSPCTFKYLICSASLAFIMANKTNPLRSFDFVQPFVAAKIPSKSMRSRTVKLLYTLYTISHQCNSTKKGPSACSFSFLKSWTAYCAVSHAIFQGRETMLSQYVRE